MEQKRNEHLASYRNPGRHTSARWPDRLIRLDPPSRDFYPSFRIGASGPRANPLQIQPKPPGRRLIPLSACNERQGEIIEVRLGTITALVTVQIGDDVIESVISRRSAEELNLKKGDRVDAVIEPAEVMIQKD